MNTSKQNQLTPQRAEELQGSFPKFVEYYVKLLGFPKVGQIQRDMVAMMVGGHQGIRMHVFRGSSKSFLLDLYIIWRLYRCPDTKILVFSAKEANAARHIREIKKLVELSPLVSWWLGQLRTENKTELDFIFSAQEAAPSIKCVGIDTAVEGARADLILADDIEIGTNSRTAASRSWLVQRMNEFQNIIHPVPRFTDEKPELTQIVVVGTFYSQFSIYLPPIDGTGHPLKGFPVFHRAALDRHDKSTFPERFPTSVLHKKRATIEEREWVLQYMLDLSAIGSLHGVLQWDKIARKEIKRSKLHNITLCLDPVTERIKGKRHFSETDEIAMTIGALVRGPTGKLNRVHIIHVDGSNKATTEEYIRHVVVPAIVKYKVMRVQVEANMPAAWNLMKKILVEQRVQGCGVMEPYYTNINKHDRILSWLEPNVNGGLVSFEPEVLEDQTTSYQVKDLTYMALPAHDDRIDTIAQLVQVFANHLAQPDTILSDAKGSYVRDV